MHHPISGGTFVKKVGIVIISLLVSISSDVFRTEFDARREIRRLPRFLHTPEYAHKLRMLGNQLVRALLQFSHLLSLRNYAFFSDLGNE